MRPGPLNLITDVEGLRVGNAQDARLKSGVTVVMADDDVPEIFMRLPRDLVLMVMAMSAAGRAEFPVPPCRAG